MSRLAHTPDPLRALEGDVLSFTILDRREVVAAMEDTARRLGGDAIQTHSFEHPYCPGFWELSVQHRSATKANAISVLKRLSGMENSRVTVFGDNTNDLDMFEVADRAVAVSNAVPAILQLATHVTQSNDENGVIRWLSSHTSAK